MYYYCVQLFSVNACFPITLAMVLHSFPHQEKHIKVNVYKTVMWLQSNARNEIESDCHG